MRENGLEYNPTEINKAVLKIEVIIGECAQMGANDSEIGDLRHLITAVEARNIEPDEAMRRAESILSSKQDYH